MTSLYEVDWQMVQNEQTVFVFCPRLTEINCIWPLAARDWRHYKPRNICVVIKFEVDPSFYLQLKYKIKESARVLKKELLFIQSLIISPKSVIIQPIR